jgi:hypothetical protein
MMFPGMATGGLIAAAVLFFVLYRRSKNRRWLELGILSCILSLMSVALDVTQAMKARKGAEEKAIKR